MKKETSLQFYSLTFSNMRDILQVLYTTKFLR